MSDPPGPRVLEIVEYEARTFGKDEIALADARTLYERFREKVEVESPSFKTDDRWKLTSQGWVGYLPVSDRMAISLRPKVPIHSLFAMFDYAYGLQSLEFLEGVYGVGTLDEFYDRLAGILARRVLDRGRRGFHRTYVGMDEGLPYVRGSINFPERMRRPWSSAIPCEYEDHTADVADNRILAWTLFCIGRSGLLSERTVPLVRKAYHALMGAVSLEPVESGDCKDRRYNRLNEDYHPTHAICRFFLDHMGPSGDRGSRESLPFLVNMGRLFEMFVAEWLREHLPKELGLTWQESFRIGGGESLRFQIDMVIYERASGRNLLILDAKYKAPTSPSTEDVLQIIGYAHHLGCLGAALIYPTAIAEPVNERTRGIGIRTMVFDIAKGVSNGGDEFLRDLLAWAEAVSRPTDLS